MNILLFYKNSAHEIHSRTLSRVEAVLKRKKLKFTKACRGSSLRLSRYDLIITVGGDGTFLEAARGVKEGTLWGVNSDPSWSVGRFCSGNPENFEKLLDKILAGKAGLKRFARLSLSFSNGTPSKNVLNDILICHRNPGAMSRYILTIGASQEEQRSSGVWIATAAGSSGGLHSAGGRVLPKEAREFQYKPRELYRGKNMHYRFKGGILKATQKITLTSLMREGVVFVDGSHVCLPFSFGAKIFVKRSPDPLKIIF